MRTPFPTLLLTAIFAGVAAVPAQTEPSDAPAPAPAVRSERKSAPHVILMYLPNRVFDVFDIVRLRLRVGPGVAAGVRATKPLSASVGTYLTVFAGLPGPRKRPQIPFPVGIEQDTGIQASVADLTVSDKDSRHVPSYGFWEVGGGFQLFLIGTEVGVDPYEVLDLATGLLAIDIVGDDL